MLMINEPSRPVPIAQQNSVISQVLDSSDPYIADEGDSSMLLDELNASKDLFIKAHPSATSLKRQQTDINSRNDQNGKLQKVLTSNQTISSGGAGTEE